MSLFLLLTGILLVIAILLIVLIPGYMNHMKDVKMTYDVQSVETAQEVALVEYMQSAASGLVMYWYDELSHSVTDSKEKAATIKGYGRSSGEYNRNAVSGAKGVPCRPTEDGGAQLLCMTVSEDSIHNIWWTGNVFSYWDYAYMTDLDRKLLKPSDYREMDATSETTARDRARARYEKDYAKELKKEEDPGKVVYNYDLINDKLYLDPSMKGRAKDESDVMAAYDIPAYSLSDAQGNIVQVTVSKDDTSMRWTEGKHGT